MEPFRVYKDFPYEIRDLDDESKKEMFKSYNSSHVCVRIGPKGYLLHKLYEKEAADIYNMKIRPTDVFVASFARSGTTWLQELVWMVLNNLDFETATAIPLTRRYAFLEIFMLITDAVIKEAIQYNGNTPEIQKIIEELATPAHKVIENAPEPRFIKTHLPMSLIPRQALDVAKVVYVARDPRDVAVSAYHHAKLFKDMLGYKGDFKQFWNNFYRNLYILTPYFEHVKEAWALRNHPNMLFLFYEELSKDLPGSIRKVMKFFNKHLTEKQISNLCEHLKIENFKNNASVNYEELRPLNMLHPGETFIRKGKTGGWRDHFDEEMTAQADRWIADNLKDTDLRFPSQLINN